MLKKKKKNLYLGQEVRLQQFHTVKSRACYKLRISNDNRRKRKMFYAFLQRESEHSDVTCRKYSKFMS